MSETGIPRRVYLQSAGALFVLLVLTVAISRLDLGVFNLLIALLIAGVKAGLVALFFMHLRYRKPIMGFFAGAGLIWLTIMIGLTLADVVNRGWLRTHVP